MSTRWKFIAALGPLLASISIFVGAVAYTKTESARSARTQATTQSDRKICEELEKLKKNIRLVLRRSDAGGEARQFRAKDCRKLPSNTSSTP